MTLQERIEKLKQAEELVADILEDMDNNAEADEVYNLLMDGIKKIHKARLRYKAQRSRQPLGVK